MSKLDHQEVDNALNQTAKEIGTRFDFRGVGASIAWSGDQAIEIRANSEERAKAVLDVFKDKLVKRGVSLKTLDAGDPKLSGKEYRMAVALKEGITQDNAKKIVQDHQGRGPEGRQGAGPGRRAPGLGQEEGRPAGGHRAAEGQGLRLRPAVHQLPVTSDGPSLGLAAPAMAHAGIADEVTRRDRLGWCCNHVGAEPPAAGARNATGTRARTLGRPEQTPPRRRSRASGGSRPGLPGGGRARPRADGCGTGRARPSAAERAGDHQVADRGQPPVGGEAPVGRAGSILRRAPARATGSPDSSAPAASARYRSRRP